MKVESFARSETHMRALHGIGVPRSAIGLFRELDCHAQTFAAYQYEKWGDAGDIVRASVSSKKQAVWAERIYTQLDHAPYVATLSDCRGGLLCRSFLVAVLSRALEGGLSPHRVSWIRLHSGFDPQVVFEADLAAGKTKPDVLVLDNVHVEDTNVKISKLRDILAYYSDAQVFVITAEHQHPMKLRERHQIVSQYGLHFTANYREDAEV